MQIRYRPRFFDRVGQENTYASKGPSIKDVSNREGERGQKLVKIADMGRGGGFQKFGKIADIVYGCSLMKINVFSMAPPPH